jgi:hypothetical protein
VEKGNVQIPGKIYVSSKFYEKMLELQQGEEFQKRLQGREGRTRGKNHSNEEFKKLTQEDGRDDFIAFFATQVCQYVWLIESRASFRMASHSEWFSLYEECVIQKLSLKDLVEF